MEKFSLIGKTEDYESSVRLYNHYAGRIKSSTDKAQLLLRKYDIEDKDPEFPFNLIEIKNPHLIHIPQNLKPKIYSKKNENFEKIDYLKIADTTAKTMAIGEFRRMKRIRENKRLLQGRKKNKFKTKIQEEIDNKPRVPARIKVKKFMKEYHSKFKSGLKESEEDHQSGDDKSDDEEEMYKGKEKFLLLMAREFYLNSKPFGSSLKIFPKRKKKLKKKGNELKEDISKSNHTMKKYDYCDKSDEKISDIGKSLSKLESVFSATIEDTGKEEESHEWNTINFEFSKPSTPRKGRSRPRSKNSLDYEYSHEETFKHPISPKSDIIKIEFGKT